MKKVLVQGSLKEALQRCAPHVSCVQHASLLSDAFGSKVAIVHSPDMSKSKSVVVKYGYDVESLSREICNMRLVAKETSVPIPKLLGGHVAQDDNDDTVMFIVMEHVSGSTLEQVWPTLDHAAKSTITSELAEYVRQLQCITGSYIGSAGKAPCTGSSFTAPFNGPFDTEEEMNKAMLYSYRSTLGGFFSTMLKNMLQTEHPIVFTHNDMHMQNVVVSHGHVSAILDWEYAGFYPNYWEYATTMYGSRFRLADDWCVYVKRFFVPHDCQAEVYALINMYLY